MLSKNSPCLRKNHSNTWFWRPFWKSLVLWSCAMIRHTCVKRAGVHCEREVWVSTWRTQWAILCCHPCAYSIQPEFKLMWRNLRKSVSVLLKKAHFLRLVGMPAANRFRSDQSLPWRRNNTGQRPGSCRACRKRITVLQTGYINGWSTQTNSFNMRAAAVF